MHAFLCQYQPCSLVPPEFPLPIQWCTSFSVSINSCPPYLLNAYVPLSISPLVLSIPRPPHVFLCRYQTLRYVSTLIPQPSSMHTFSYMKPSTSLHVPFYSLVYECLIVSYFGTRIVNNFMAHLLQNLAMTPVFSPMAHLYEEKYIIIFLVMWQLKC